MVPTSLLDFTTYPTDDTETLLLRLATVTSELANIYGELAMIESQNIRDRARVLQSCGETSSNGRRDRVNMEVVEGPATVIELAGQRDALVEEKFFIVRILDGRR